MKFCYGLDYSNTNARVDVSRVVLPEDTYFICSCTLALRCVRSLISKYVAQHSNKIHLAVFDLPNKGLR